MIIVDAPDNETIAALSLAAAASGLVTGRTTVLLTPEQMDKVAKKSVKYTPPGK